MRYCQPEEYGAVTFQFKNTSSLPELVLSCSTNTKKKVVNNLFPHCLPLLYFLLVFILKTTLMESLDIEDRVDKLLDKIDKKPKRHSYTVTR